MKGLDKYSYDEEMGKWKKVEKKKWTDKRKKWIHSVNLNHFIKIHNVKIVLI